MVLRRRASAIVLLLVAVAPLLGACSDPSSSTDPEAVQTSTSEAIASDACQILARLTDAGGLDDDHVPDERSIAAVLARAFRLLRPPIPLPDGVLAEVFVDRTRPELLEPLAGQLELIDGVVVLERLTPEDVVDECRRRFPGDTRLIETLPLPLSPIIRIGGAPAALEDVEDLLVQQAVNAQVITPAELDAERERGVGAVAVMFDEVRPALAEIGAASDDVSAVAADLARVELDDPAAVEAARPHVNTVLDHAEEACGIEVAS